jgi:hypothetical protein
VLLSDSGFKVQRLKKGLLQMRHLAQFTEGNKACVEEVALSKHRAPIL